MTRRGLFAHGARKCPARLPKTLRSRADGEGPTEATGPDLQPALAATNGHCLAKRELAAYLGIGYRTLERAIAQGLLPPADLMVGRSPRWSPKTIERWLACKPKLPGRMPK